ncbi:lipopolysaccharide biosynthesis protein [Klebsiella sp. R445]
MNRYSKLLNNSAIFALGSLGSKIIIILLVPLYTYYLSSQDYGVVDLISSTQALMMPFVTLTVEQALLRFLIGTENKDQINSIFSSSIFVCSITLLFLLLTCGVVILSDLWNPRLVIYFYFLVMASVFQVLFSTYLRAIGETKKFALSGVIQVLALLVLNALFLVYFKMGVDGYLLSLIGAYVVSALYCAYCSRGVIVSFSLINKQVIHKIIQFSLPLIPNYSMWWLVNNSTRYIVLSFIGLSANGLFAVASKIPMCINVFVTVFQQAWQISAFEEFESKDRSRYYSSVFRSYYQFLFLLASLLLVANKWIFTYLVSSEYFLAWEMVPFLVYGVLYQTFSSFLGTIYTANYKTKSVFYTSVIGAVISIGANFIFIPLYGAVCAGVGASLGFFVMWYLRLRDTRKIIYTELKCVEFSFLNVIYFVQVAFLYVFQELSLSIQFIIQLMLFIFVCYLSRAFLISVFGFAKQKLLKKTPAA